MMAELRIVTRRANIIGSFEDARKTSDETT
jgi:hypothetical protein